MNAGGASDTGTADPGVGSRSLTNPASRKLATPDRIEFPDVAVGKVITEDVWIYNVDTTYEAYIALSIDDVRDRTEIAPFQIVSAPSRLRPSREGQPEPVRIAFQSNRAATFTSTLRVTANWQDPSIPRERWNVALRGWTRGDDSQSVDAPRVSAVTATTPATGTASPVGRSQAGPCRAGVRKIAENADFVPYVRKILVAKGWAEAAKFQELWLRGPANSLVGKASDGRGSKGPVRIVDTSFDWLLQFDRCRRLFDSMCNSTVYANQAATNLLMSHVLEKFRRLGSSIVPLGNPNARRRSLETEYVNSRPLGREAPYAYYSYGDSKSYGIIDELTAAYGNLTMYVVAYGQADRSQGRVKITIDRLGVYARDSFDFEGEQYLGSWRLPNGMTVAPLDDGVSNSPEMLFPRCPDVGWFGMTNAIYRRYRAKYGRGGDFVIYTDVKSVPLDPVFQYVY